MEDKNSLYQRFKGIFTKKDIEKASNTIAGITNQSWMSPSQPITPIQTEEKDARGWDFPVGLNLTYTPRATEKTKFDQLRFLADNCGIVRSIIEARKDQVSRFKFKFVLKNSEEQLQDAECERIAALFETPDGVHNWDEWIRLILEEMFVTDAVCIYPRKNYGGKTIGLQPIDGTTIHVLVDELGFTPLGDEPAYQQIIKGVVKNNFSVNELVYKPRNVRIHKLYGFSPVEQIQTTINLVLRKEHNQLSYYLEGNVPNLLFGAPKEWNVDQIEKFQKYWDEVNSGGVKTKARMLPPDVDIHNTKPEPLKDDFDDYLSRLVAYAFSVPASPFIKEMNRATAETSKQSSHETGLASLLEWIRNLINYIIVKHLDSNKVEFVWDIEEEEDPEAKMRIDIGYKNAGIMTANEIRLTLGLEPLKEELLPNKDNKDEKSDLPEASTSN